MLSCDGKAERRRKKEELFALIRETIGCAEEDKKVYPAAVAAAEDNEYYLRPDLKDPGIISFVKKGIDWKKTFRMDRDELEFTYVYPQRTFRYQKCERSAG